MERKHKTSSKSVEIVVSLDDLLLEILFRLPIKTLIRFKSVSKRWLSLITNPKFCHRRSVSAPKLAAGLFVHLIDPYDGFEYDYVPFSMDGTRNPPFRKLNFAHDPRGIKILNSCNGLFLCRTKVNSHRKFYVCNPTTNQFFLLPEREKRLGISDKMYAMNLAFDPIISPNYKVVCVLKSNQKYLFEIYHSETRDWRKWGDPIDADFDFHHGIYWNGSINWKTWRPDVELLHFDVERHLLEKMPMPPRRAPLLTHFTEESGGHFYFVMWAPLFRFVVHEMKLDYSGWFVKFQVDLSRPAPEAQWFPTGLYVRSINAIGVMHGKEEKDCFLVLQLLGRKVVRYHLGNKTFEDPYEYETDLMYQNMRGFQYIESLSCV